jgi:pyridoxamine 5'-phosphate oxidase
MQSIAEDNILADPVKLFDAWYADAKNCKEIKLAEAMCLATVCSDGYPEARVVLLKGFDAEGFVFYTNSHSDKGKALAFAPKAELCFYWMPLDRQVRIQGDVHPVPDEESDAYFATRPRGSQLSAWASEQSAPVKDRAELEASMARFEKKYEGKDVPRPSHWIGYRLMPLKIEFWQNRDDRLHDRFRYDRLAQGAWRVRRVSP